MDDDKPSLATTPAPIELVEGWQTYAPALIAAWKEQEEIAAKEKELAFRKAKINDTVDALTPLIFKRSWDINSLNLSNAIRFIFSHTKRPLSAAEVRVKLEDLGYNTEQFNNPLASIHTALQRMQDTNEVYLVPNEDKKKTFEPGPELKPIPEPKTELPEGAMAALGLGLDAHTAANNAAAERLLGTKKD